MNLKAHNGQSHANQYMYGKIHQKTKGWDPEVDYSDTNLNFWYSEFQYVCGVSVWRYEEIVDIFGGSLQNMTILGVIFIELRAFNQGRWTEWEYVFGVTKISIFLGGMPYIPDICLG